MSGNTTIPRGGPGSQALLRKNPRIPGKTRRLKGFASGSGVCDIYDLAVHKTKADVERNQRVYDTLEIGAGTDILDIGCGTGSLVDFRFQDIRPERYVGVDPSRGMLGVFRDKHPEFRSRLIRTSFEDYWPKPGQTFDLVVGLFGVASHIGEPDFLSGKVRWLLRPGGTAVLMYNARKPGDMDFYRSLGINTPDGAMVSNEFWTVAQDEDSDWITAVGSKLQDTPPQIETPGRKS